MITKLKLQIDLSNKMNININGVSEEYSLKITFIDKDERFEAESPKNRYGVGSSLMYNGVGSFFIKSLWNEKFGGISDNGILLPHMDRLGIEHKKTFDDDMHRYTFLKRLYKSIDEWANYWWGFTYDSNSFIEVNDNIWEVLCSTVYNGSMDFLRTQYENI